MGRSTKTKPKGAGKGRAKKPGGGRSADLKADERDKLSGRAFAFPKKRKEPLIDAKHVRNAIARFGQVKSVTGAEKDAAWKRIKKAAKRFEVHVSERSWHELGKAPESKGPTGSKAARRKQ